MQYSTALLALAAGVNAHTLMSEIYVDGKGQGAGTCVRTPKSAYGAINPITDLGSSDMACGKDGTNPVSRTCDVNGGSSLTFEYRQWPDDPSKQPLDEGHMGPCAVYLKKVADATKDEGPGDGWFKLWDDGYDESSGKWCTNKMIGNNGRITVTIPESLRGGDYLVRPELLALHNVHKGVAEFYIGCAQVFLDSAGQDGPASTVSIPGHVSKSDSNVMFDPFDKPMKLPYTPPGPKVYSSVQMPNIKSNVKQTDGQKPADCVVTNANWCGTELPSYSDEDGCWDADKNCWDQLDLCYHPPGSESSPPTGVANCKVWEQKCYDNQDVCKSSNPSGPPNKGKNLTKDPDTISVPAAVNQGMSYGASGSSSNYGSSDSNNDVAAKVAAPANENSDSSDSSDSNSNNNQEPQNDYTPSTTTVPATTNSPQAQVQTTTFATVTSAAPQNNNGDPNVVVEWATDVVYETVYATETASPHGHWRRHARRADF